MPESLVKESCVVITQGDNSSRRYRTTSFLWADATLVFTEQGLCQEKAPQCPGDLTQPLGKGPTAAKSGHFTSSEPHQKVPHGDQTSDFPTEVSPHACVLSTICQSSALQSWVDNVTSPSSRCHVKGGRPGSLHQQLCSAHTNPNFLFRRTSSK